MKAIVLENGFDIDIPTEFIRYLTKNKIDWEYKDARFMFWPENRKTSYQWFESLPEGQKFYASTVFDGYDQLECFIELLDKLKHKKFEFNIQMYSLGEEFMDWLKQTRADTNPKELQNNFDKAENDEEIKKTWKKITDFKEDLNKKFFDVLENHSIYWIWSAMSCNESEKQLIKSADDFNFKIE